MNERYTKWSTPWLSREFEMLVFGNSKDIKHWLDDGKWRGHDWNYWRDMLPYYLSV
jgi:esterase/lipase superfamily enzyme